MRAVIIHHGAALAAELITWNKTGVLPDPSLVRQVAADISPDMLLVDAEEERIAMVERLAMHLYLEERARGHDASMTRQLQQACRDLMMIMPGYAGCGDLSREQRTMADVRRLVPDLPSMICEHG